MPWIGGAASFDIGPNGRMRRLYESGSLGIYAPKVEIRQQFTIICRICPKLAGKSDLPSYAPAASERMGCSSTANQTTFVLIFIEMRSRD